MCQEEFEFLIKNFGVEHFNLHPTREFPLLHQLPAELRKIISIENSSSQTAITAIDLAGFGGICLDLAHYESLRRKQPIEANKLADLVQRRGVCANHLSALQDLPEVQPNGQLEYSTHYLHIDSSIDFVTRLPEWMLGPICALELENPLFEQLAAIKRLGMQSGRLPIKLAA